MADNSREQAPAHATSETTHVQSVRVRGELRARIDSLVVLLRERPPGLRVSRSNVLIAIIEAGLAALEKELQPPPAGDSPHPSARRLASTRARRSDANPHKKSA